VVYKVRTEEIIVCEIYFKKAAVIFFFARGVKKKPKSLLRFFKMCLNKKQFGIGK